MNLFALLISFCGARLLSPNNTEKKAYIIDGKIAVNSSAVPRHITIANNERGKKKNCEQEIKKKVFCRKIFCNLGNCEQQ